MILLCIIFTLNICCNRRVTITFLRCSFIRSFFSLFYLCNFFVSAVLLSDCIKFIKLFLETVLSRQTINSCYRKFFCMFRVDAVHSCTPSEWDHFSHHVLDWPIRLPFTTIVIFTLGHDLSLMLVNGWPIPIQH